MLVLRRLTKRYNKLAAPAVNAVSLGVERGECFGLLGLNGAGKTTIFKMLTGDTLISGGDAQVAGRSVRADMDSARRVTGYCPQFDALVPLLTVREHLELYSGLRGVPASARAHTVRRCIDLLGLGALEKSQARHLFGGNKRKLSVAIALVGDPLLVYMVGRAHIRQHERTVGIGLYVRPFLHTKCQCTILYILIYRSEHAL
ncbi:hypothetical protein ONE63_003416 [Megalurothrips usitatus]|uniref:ABC transporter domain-containing protein n=1 Tax=Megalurothrips usitatus TaxID=439358 RepID=A0AAV7XDS7_9NEOP|nr:hypothetical protein ONE63_003416 [Megalurothrips usitatus]